MAATAIDVPALTAAGYAALRRGDPQAARQILAPAVVGGVADAAVWLGLSNAHRALGEVAEADRALDRALELDTYYFPALFARGDVLAVQGDRRGANAYYAAGL